MIEHLPSFISSSKHPCQQPRRFLLTRYAVWGLGLLMLLFSSGCCGCIRDILDFPVASSGLSRPTRGLTCKNKERVIDRIRWFELVQRWERQLKAHALSQFLEPYKSAPIVKCNADCSTGGPSCCDCFQVDYCSGFIDLACYTKTAVPNSEILSGKIKMDVGTIEQTEGEAFFEWEDVCFPAAKSKDPTIRGICVDGATSYRVEIDDAKSPKRFDYIWTVRLWVQEGNNDAKLRLDGAVGYNIHERRTNVIPNTKRSAIYFEESSILYSHFLLKTTPDPTQVNPVHALSSDGEVQVLGTTGEYRCCFKVDPASGKRTSSCIRKDNKEQLCASDQNICPP